MKQSAGNMVQGAGASGRRRSVVRRFSRALRPALCALSFLAACATQPAPPLAAPDWPAIPTGVMDALCARLQMDAIATGSPLTLVSTTRPLANPQSLSALAMTVRGRVKTNRVAMSSAELNRSLPILTDGATCRWRPIAASQLDAHRDEMVVELSAPALHPFAPKTGGMFARVTVGGEGASWYWITLFPSGGRWAVGPVYVLVQ
ncbi:MAG: hypothetical protein ACXW5U_11530 [Thermoanaerobaculia bacterium]